MRLRLWLAALALVLTSMGTCPAAENDDSLWAALKDSRDLDALLSAEQQLRETPYGDLARQRIEMLKRQREDELKRQTNLDASIRRPQPSETDTRSPANEPPKVLIRAPAEAIKQPVPPNEPSIISLTPPNLESKPPVEPPKVVVVLPPPKTDVPPLEVIDQKEIIARIQARLRDGGCYAGPVDGKWGAKSTEALEKFVELAKLDVKSSEPTRDVLDKIVLITRRVCPLEAKAEPKDDEKPVKKAARTTKDEEEEKSKPLAKPKVWSEEEKKPRKAQETANDTSNANNPTRRKSEIELGKDRVERICKNNILSPGRRIYLGCK